MMERVIEKYREKGLKMTPQRIAIIEYLEGNTAHPTADEIFGEIKKKYPTVSFATVYNTVQALMDVGSLIEVTIDPRRKHYDPNTSAHHHIVCTICNKIEDVFIEFKELKLPEEVEREFIVKANHVNFYGVCRKCKN